MYQQVLRRFAHFNAIQLSDPALLHELIMMALKEEEDNDDEDLDKIAEVIFLLFAESNSKVIILTSWKLGF